MKTKTIAFLAVLGFLSIESSAQVYIAKNSEISFFSEAIMENIEAVNHKASSLLNTETGQLVFKVPIGAFEFEKDLMKEHFNENYMETEKFPKGSFNGSLNGDLDYTKDGTYPAKAVGKLVIHGIEKERTMEGIVVVKDGSISLVCEFKVKLADHDIAIPKVVVKNIAEEVLVKLKADFSPYEKKK
jgi:hypothetical protein